MGRLRRQAVADYYQAVDRPVTPTIFSIRPARVIAGRQLLARMRQAWLLACIAHLPRLAGPAPRRSDRVAHPSRRRARRAIRNLPRRSPAHSPMSHEAPGRLLPTRGAPPALVGLMVPGARGPCDVTSRYLRQAACPPLESLSRQSDRSTWSLHRPYG